jgi:type III restriction enzyme
MQKQRSGGQRGVKSNEAYTREVLGERAYAQNPLVLHDEAQHAWRVNWEAVRSYLHTRDLKDSTEEAAVSRSGRDTSIASGHPELL